MKDATHREPEEPEFSDGHRGRNIILCFFGLIFICIVLGVANLMCSKSANVTARMSTVTSVPR